MKTSRINLVLILISVFFNAKISAKILSNSNQTYEYYQESVEEVNHYLSQESLQLFCPGVNLVVSCGNRVCEPHKNESLENCPADCKENVSVRSYNSVTLCDQYTQTQIPQNIAEVADIIKMAVSKNQTVKPIGASHSATEIMCAKGVVLPLSKLNKVLGIEKAHGKTIVSAQAGVTVWELSEWLHQRGWALEGLPHMGFRDVTIGGAIATGSHGSSPKHSGVISNIVEEIELIDGSGVKRTFSKESTPAYLFKSLTTSLGMLGVFTKIKLRIQKQFNLDVEVTYHKEKVMLNEGLINQVKDCDYGQINWFPGIEKFVKTCGKKTKLNEYSGANNVLLSPKFPKFIVNPFKKVLQLGACFNTLMGLVEQVRYWQFKLAPPLVMENKKGKLVHRKKVIGPSHRMVSSHLTEDQDGFFQMDWEIAVPQKHAQAALQAINDLVDQQDIKLPLVGVFIRFAPIEDESLLAHTHADGKDWIKGETAVFFEMPVYIPVGFSKENFQAYEKKYRDFANMLIEQFSGRPHWGKNRAWTFTKALAQGQYNSELNQFKKAKSLLDPKGTFNNWFSNKILNL